MYRKCKLILMAVAPFLLFAGQLHAESFSGKITDVLDGDTVQVQHDGKTESVRLAQIYAPVEGQPFGIAAGNYVWRTAGNRTVTVRFDTYDLYGRPVGEVFLSDGTNLNKLIVKSGFAWQYEGYSNDPDYAELEAAARKEKLGLWSVENPVPPWEWRVLQVRAALMKNSRGKSSGNGFVCGSKQFCYEMSNCQEAKFYLYACGLTRLDRDGNGVPCETKCK